jgi:hypothetical protein
MKSLTRLWQEMASELAIWCDTSAERDILTMRARVEHEGLSFLTITLPNLCTAFESWLDVGKVSSQESFKTAPGGLPRFLGGFLSSVFDTRTGVLKEDPDWRCVSAIRQLCLVFKKIELDCTEPRKRAAVQDYLDCERELEQLDGLIPHKLLQEFGRISSLLFGDTMNEMCDKIDHFTLVPHHGPGATADRKVGNQKFVQTEWPDRLEPYFPFGEYVLPHWKYFQEFRPQFINPKDEMPVKVTLVPKTLKTPRVIAIEPTAMQYAQQAIMQQLVPSLESRTSSRDFIGFTDQEPNRFMACRGSIDGSLATLDLKEASDRVLNSLVLRMTKPYPTFSEAVQACRSEWAILPDGRSATLSKFASMGSALCFPIEAMVFTTIVFLGLQDAVARKLSAADISAYRGSVRVYGDDIIVPADSVTYVVRALEAFGLKVNTKKSFWTGRFRESCGGDYFGGREVTPVRLKHVAPTRRQDVDEIVSWVAFANALEQRGFLSTAEFARQTVERALRERLSEVGPNSSALGWILLGGQPLVSNHPTLHVPVVKAHVVMRPIPANAVDGVWALRKTLPGGWSDPVFQRHLSHSGRPSSARIKKKWVPATER